jgi:hypothetical protein
MTDANIIFIYLEKIIPNDHPLLYQYIIGRDRSKFSATKRVIDECGAFKNSFPDAFIKKVVSQFLELKKRQHIEGTISVKSIY